MNTQNNKRIRHFPVLFMSIGFLCFFSATESNAQKTGEKSEKHIVLKKDARKNGYKIIIQDGTYYFEANKVTDSVSKKLIEGVHRLLYRCNENGQELPLPATFIRGNSNRIQVACLILIQPRILLLDEND